MKTNIKFYEDGIEMSAEQIISYYGKYTHYGLVLGVRVYGKATLGGARRIRGRKDHDLRAELVK